MVSLFCPQMKMQLHPCPNLFHVERGKGKESEAIISSFSSINNNLEKQHKQKNCVLQITECLNTDI